MCSNLNIPEMELAKYTIQGGIEIDRYESLTWGLLDESKGGPPPKYPYGDLYKRTFPLACISVFSVINGYAVFQGLPEAILNYMPF